MKRILFEVPHPAPTHIRLENEPFHHLVHVLRSEPGEAIEVFDGHGRTIEATLIEVTESDATLSLGQERRIAIPRAISILQGLPKSEKWEFILQKGTELGARAFVPVSMVRCVAKVTSEKEEKKTARFRKIVEEASRQCGRADVPEVFSPRSLEEAVGRLPLGTVLWVLDEAEKSLRLSQAFARLPEGTPVALVVGPEGGIDDSERRWLVQQNAMPVTLGPRILRTETASLAALSVLQHLMGELG